MTQSIPRKAYAEKVLDYEIIKAKRDGAKDYLTKISGIVIGIAVLLLIVRLFFTGFSFFSFIFSFQTFFIVGITVIICGPILGLGTKDIKKWDAEIQEKKAELELFEPIDC